jgi:hypothetical protein
MSAKGSYCQQVMLTVRVEFDGNTTSSCMVTLNVNGGGCFKKSLLVRTGTTQKATIDFFDIVDSIVHTMTAKFLSAYTV